MQPAQGNIFTYGLFRHGETVWNREKRVQGHQDSPLTAKGESALRQWALQLAAGNWQHILCSDLGRVRQSVEIVNEVLKLTVTINENLREQDWGDWEGMKVREVYEHYPEELARQAKRGWHFRPPGGESRREVQNRFFRALGQHRENSTTANTLVVCHLGVIKCAIYSIVGRKFLEGEPPLLEKDTMHTLGYNGKYTISSLNIALKDPPQ